MEREGEGGSNESSQEKRGESSTAIQRNMNSDGVSRLVVGVTMGRMKRNKSKWKR